MHVLVLPSFYPEKHRPNSGLFFFNQTKIVADYVDKIGVVYVEQKSIKKIFNSILSNLYQKEIKFESGVLTYRRKGLSILNQYNFGSKIWIYLTEKLIFDYIKDNGKPDIIHVHNLFNAGCVAYKIEKKFGIPFVITEHASSFLLETYTVKQLNICRSIVDKSLALISVSSALSISIKKQLGNRKINVVPNVFDTTLFKLRKKTPKDVYVFVCVGNLIPNKGQLFLIKSFALAFPVYNSIQLLIIGDGPDKEELENYVESNNLSDRIFFKNSISPSTLANTYNECDCLVSPSTKETFGVVIIEAMACGLPVIATRSGGPQDIINEENGILVDYGSENQMAEALKYLVLNKMKYNPTVISQIINEKFSPQVIASQIIKFYV